MQGREGKQMRSGMASLGPNVLNHNVSDDENPVLYKSGKLEPGGSPFPTNINLLWKPQRRGLSPPAPNNSTQSKHIIDDLQENLKLLDKA